MFVPLLLKPPGGRPARVLGGGPKVLPIVQKLLMGGWSVQVHEKRPGIGRLEGAKSLTHAPPAPSLRQASLVLIGSACSDEWREEALKHLEGSGVPVWDERSPGSSTLAFPLWFTGGELSLAAWSDDGTASPWQEALAGEIAGIQKKLMEGFVKLAGEVGGLVFSNSPEDEFLKKAATQLATPGIIGALAVGDYDKAKTTALKIVGATTRSLD